MSTLRAVKIEDPTRRIPIIDQGLQLAGMLPKESKECRIVLAECVKLFEKHANPPQIHYSDEALRKMMGIPI